MIIRFQLVNIEKIVDKNFRTNIFENLIRDLKLPKDGVE